MKARNIVLIAMMAFVSVACSATQSSSSSAELTESEQSALQQKCNADDAAACKRLGKMWSRRDGNKARKRARSYYAKACDLGHRTSCLLREVANPVTPEMSAKMGDDIEGVDLAQFQRYCLGGEEDYCNALTYYLWDEDAERDDIWVLRRSFAVACVKGHDDFCALLAATLDRGYGGFDRDPHAAFWISDYACDKREHGSSCHFKGIAYQTGEAVDYSEERCTEFTLKGCNLDDMHACADAAHFLRVGQGIEADPERGLELAENSCDEESGSGCRALGYFYLEGAVVDRSIKRGINYLEEGCELDDARSCFEAGRAVEESGIHPRKVAVQYYLKAEEKLLEYCERRRFGWSCAWLANLYSATNIKRNSRYSQELLRKRGCRLDPRYCDKEKLEKEKYDGTL